MNQENGTYCVACKRVSFAKSHHLFPRDVPTRLKWLDIIGIKSNFRTTRVCSDHFHHTCFTKPDGKRRRLLPGALPNGDPYPERIVVKTEVEFEEDVKMEPVIKKEQYTPMEVVNEDYKNIPPPPFEYQNLNSERPESECCSSVYYRDSDTESVKSERPVEGEMVYVPEQVVEYDNGVIEENLTPAILVKDEERRPYIEALQENPEHVSEKVKQCFQLAYKGLMEKTAKIKELEKTNIRLHNKVAQFENQLKFYEDEAAISEKAKKCFELAYQSLGRKTLKIEELSKTNRQLYNKVIKLENELKFYQSLR